MNSSIFREYDIRGIADEDLTDDVVSDIGLAMGTIFAKKGLKKISIGRDCRKSSERIFKVLSSSIIKAGISIIDLGMITTPVLYFSLYGLKIDGGVMITASHNPSDYNGFKAAIGKDVLSAAQIQEIKNIIRSKSFIQDTNLGTIEELNLIDIYKKDILKSINLNKKIRIGVDCANTPIGLFAKDIMSDAGCEVYELYPEPNGDFPNHHPDPSVEENLKDLVSLVKREELDFGISFDGDADRIGVVDENGSFIYSDMVLLLLARSVLKDNPGAKIIGEVKCSKNLFEDIKKNGGIPIMWRTGHSNIKRKVKEESAPLAGELSGHIFFADKHHGFDDALYAGLRLAEVASYHDGTFSSMLRDIPQMYSTPEMRIDFPEEEKFKFIEQFTKFMESSMSSSHRLVTVDGIRIETDDGWALVRASNTQPALTIRFEANSEKNLKELMQYVQKEISKVTDKICIF